MPPKMSNAQFKNRLAYDAGTRPAFLRALQARISGKPDPTLGGGDRDDEDAEWEQLDASRPAIPRRPDAREEDDTQRPEDEDEEDFDDERPTVVVLKEGKHLTEWEVENEKRKLKGLPPLPPPDSATTGTPDSGPASTSKDKQNATSSSSTNPKAKVSMGARAAPKRKLDAASDATVGGKGSGSKKGDGKDKEKGPVKKKPKKESKNLLSFGGE